jgi:drug/metabolite transporter (DMT)-like permease
LRFPRIDGIDAIAARASMPLVILTWGMGPPVTALVKASPEASTFLRFWFAYVVLTIVILTTRRSLPLRVLLRSAPSGCCFALNNLSFFIAIQHASVVVVSVLFTLQPVFVVVLGVAFLGERVTRRQLLWTAVGVLGAVIVVAGASGAVRSDAFGILMALLSTLAQSVYHVLNRAARRVSPVDPLAWMTGVTFFGAVMLTPIAIIATRVSDYRGMDATDLGSIAFLGVGVGVLGHALMMSVHKHLEASTSALYLLLYNVVAVVVAWPLNHEPLTLVQALGGLVVLAAAAAIAIRPAGGKLETAVNTIVD